MIQSLTFFLIAEGCAEAGSTRWQGQTKGSQGSFIDPRDRLDRHGHERTEADSDRRSGSSHHSEQTAKVLANGDILGWAGERAREEGGAQEGRSEEGGAQGGGGSEEGGAQEGRAQEGGRREEEGGAREEDRPAGAVLSGAHQGLQGLQSSHDHALLRAERRGQSQWLHCCVSDKSRTMMSRRDSCTACWYGNVL